MINTRENGRYVNPSKMTFGEYLIYWLKVIKKPDIATTTFDNYKKKINAHILPELGGIILQNLQSYHIEMFLDYKRKNGRINRKGGLSENTLKKIFVIINSSLTEAEEKHYIKNNPAKLVNSPNPKEKESKHLEINELKQIISIAKNTDLFIYTFIIFVSITGVRRSEALGVEWNDVDFNKGTLTIRKRLIPSVEEIIKHEDETKTKSSTRKIALYTKLVEILKKYKKIQDKNKQLLGKEYNTKKDFIFCKQNGYPYYPNSINRKIKKIFIKANISKKYKGYVGPHILRHTFATLTLDKEINPEIIRKILGHSSIKTTLDTYYHVELKTQKYAINILENEIFNE